MKRKAPTAEQLQRAALRREKEIAKWEKEKARPKKDTYLIYLIFILTLIYATDEVASQIGTLMKTEIANDLMASFGDKSVAILDLVGIVIVPFQIIGLIYRPLADRFGRKAFLILNTFGMSIALLVIFLSNNLILYFLGACMIAFFIPHDMHVVYIMETAPAKHRAIMYSCIKFVANMGVMLVPVLRRALMTDASQWRQVYFIPAIIGLVCSFIALLSARETDAFIDSRLRYLKMTDEERAQAEKARKAEDSQGGLINALRFAWKHKQLKWLYITAAIANLGFILTIEYQVIMTYGYAQNFLTNGLYPTIDAALNAVSIEIITPALFLFTVGSACAQVIMGFISDWLGRKKAAITMAALCVASFLGFYFGSNLAWSPYIVGFLCGSCIGSYYSTNDVLIMMIGESAPTNLRSSAITAQYIVVAIGFAITYMVALPLAAWLGNSAVGIIALCFLVPGFVAALFTLSAKVGDTRGLDLDTVTGCEWDD
ncbi:MAG: MFS transporter [Oscillospiraceae bacterium]|nr:MFS transporter [Oscillospiraceae bacterium]MBR5261141.1 MFS transporter [Oscillospiraceae bacterium]